MVELIVTMIMIGILAAVALPRMNVLGGFDEIGFRDQVVSALEFARKSAVVQRRNVRVSLAGSALTFNIDSDVPDGPAANTFDRNLTIPGGTHVVAPRGSTALAGPATLVFTAEGRAEAASHQYTFTGESTQTLTVDPGTGYVAHN